MSNYCPKCGTAGMAGITHACPPPSSYGSLGSPIIIGPTGWKCPGCGRCYAPGFAMCSFCGPVLPDIGPPAPGEDDDLPNPEAEMEC